MGRALQALGIEHILGQSPQARGRRERVNRTLQDRLVNELRLAGIRTLPAANRYLREHFLPTYNTTFGRRPTDPASAFVPVTLAQLEPILYHEEARVVARDNTVSFDRVVLQISKQRGRRSCAGLPVLVRRHLDGRHPSRGAAVAWAAMTRPAPPSGPSPPPPNPCPGTGHFASWSRRTGGARLQGHRTETGSVGGS